VSTLVVSEYEPGALPHILETVRSARLPNGTSILIGSYGISQADARQIEAVPNAAYAPIFGIQPGTSAGVRAARKLPAADAAKVPAAHAGPIPADASSPVLPPEDQREWGIELGRRFRDELRAADGSVSHWQFDEILSQCGQPDATSWRAFVGGVLNGLAFGRPELGDQRQSGLVWIAWGALSALPAMPNSSELGQFWTDVDAASRFLIGEEYADFDGDPGSAARTYAAPQHTLLTLEGAPIRNRLGQRYIAGLTPGANLAPGLGGNIHENPPSWVNGWRSEFLAARRTAAAPAGFAQYSLAQENAHPQVIADAIAAIADALHQ